MQKNKIFYGVVGLVAILVLAFVVGYWYALKSSPLAGNLEREGVTKYDSVAAGDATIRYATLSIGTGSSTATLVNRAAFSRYISFSNSFLHFSGNATDTPYRIHVGTSTSQVTSKATSTTDLAYNAAQIQTYVMPAYAGLLNGLRWATSTVATTTSLVSGPKSSLNGDIYEWKAGETLYMSILVDVDSTNQDRNVFCPGGTAAGRCSSASSTDRGFNIDAVFQTISTSTVR